MEISQALQVVSLNIQAEQQHFDGIKTTTLMGKPGIGKTAMMKQLAKQMKLNFYHVSAPEISIEQLTGLPEFSDIPQEFYKYSVSGQKEPKGTAWSCPEIVATANQKAMDPDFEGCIMLLDDIHETPLSTIPYFYQLLNEKKVSGWGLDKKVYIVCAMNDSDSANFSGLPSPIINRMSVINAEFDSAVFLEGYGVSYNYLIRSFLKSYPNYLSEDESTECGFGTPRSWTQFNNSFEFMLKEDKRFLIDNICAIAEGSVSNKAALALTTHITYIERLNLNKYVEERELLDVSTLDALDQVLLGYIVNFIDTVDDAQYLVELLEKNIHNKSFVGFCASEIYLKFKAQEENKEREGDKTLRTLPLGLALFLEKGLEVGTFDIANYGNLTKKELETVENFKINNKIEFFNCVMPYIQ